MNIWQMQALEYFINELNNTEDVNSKYILDVTFKGEKLNRSNFLVYDNKKQPIREKYISGSSDGEVKVILIKDELRIHNALSNLFSSDSNENTVNNKNILDKVVEAAKNDADAYTIYNTLYPIISSLAGENLIPPLLFSESWSNEFPDFNRVPENEINKFEWVSLNKHAKGDHDILPF